MSRPSYYRLPVLVLLVFFLVACGGEEEAGDFVMGEPLEDSTLAILVSSDFGGDTLTTTAFRAGLGRMMQQYGPMLNRLPEDEREQRREDLRRRLAENFVMSHLVQGKIEELGIEPDIDSAAVAQQVSRQMGMMQQLENFDQMLAQRNLTEESLRGLLQQRIRAQMRVRSQQQILLDSLTQDIEEPTPTTIDTFIQNRRNEQVRAQHILFTLPSDTTEAYTDSVRAVASAILDSAQAGADFGALAQNYSEGPSGPRGGDLGYFNREDMVDPFAEAAFALQDSGDVADELVRSRFGFHIIRLTGRRLAPPMDTTQAKQLIAQRRRQEVVEEALDELRSQATIRVNEDVVQADLNAPEEEMQPPTGGQSVQ